MPTRPEIITALPIAFGRDGSLDLEGTRAIFAKAAGSGVEGALVLGTTGEFVSLGYEERGDIVRLALDELDGMRCIVHVGAASLYEVRRLIEQARSAGAREIAVLTPYYLPVSDDELLRFYTAVAEAAAGMDVYVYVFRDRTGVFVTPELMAEIAALPGIVGAKISGESLDTVAAYRAAVPESFVLYTGSDRDIARAAAYGAQGVVSGIASAIPRPFTQIAQLIADGADGEALAAAQEAVDDTVDTIQGDMARMKAALRLQGIPAGWPRMAIAEPDEAGLADLERVVRRYDAVAVAP